jgi:hypothetical protein
MKQLPVGKYGQHGVTMVDDCDEDIAGGRTISKLASGKGYCFIGDYYSNGNSQNHTSHRNGRLVGTCFDKQKVKWRAQIEVDGKQKTLGYFLTEAEAHQAYLEAVANP